MSGLDIAYLIVVILTALFGLKRGLFSEVFALVSLLLAVALATLFASAVGELFGHVFSNQTYNILFGFFIILIVVILVSGVLHFLIRVMTFSAPLGVGSRLLGAMVGFVKGGMFVVLIAFAIASTPWQSSPWFADSKVSYQLGSVVAWLQGEVFKEKPKLSLSYLKTKTQTYWNKG